MTIKERLNKIRYTIKHRKAIRRIEKQIIGKNSLRIYFHDLDKIPLILFFGSKASKIHRKYSRHHDKAKTKQDYIEMILDWECARFTKPDKPLNARETLYKYYPYLVGELRPILEELKL